MKTCVPSFMRRAWIAVVVFTVAVIGCARPAVMPEDEIVDNANRIVLVIDDPNLIEQEPVPLSVLNDARLHLEDAGFEVESVDEGNLRLSTEPRQVRDDLALRIQMNVQQEGGGNLLVASSEWAQSVEENEWQEAAWTSGQARTAFDETLRVVTGIRHQDVSTRVE